MSGHCWSLSRIWSQRRWNGNETGGHKWNRVAEICLILDPIRDTVGEMAHKPVHNIK